VSGKVLGSAVSLTAGGKTYRGKVKGKKLVMS
jgi:hypothetical protein